MSLHKPVPRLRLASAHIQVLPGNPLRAGLVLLQWIFWHPQALAKYAQRWERNGSYTVIPSVRVLFTYLLPVALLFCLPAFVAHNSFAGRIDLTLAILVSVSVGATLVCTLFETEQQAYALTLIIGVPGTLLASVLLASLVAFSSEGQTELWSTPLLALELALFFGIGFSGFLAFESGKYQPSASDVVTGATAIATVCGGAIAYLGRNMVADIVPYGVINFVFAAIGFVAGFFRIDNWLWASLSSRRVSTGSPYALDPIPWVTQLPVSRMNEIMRDWLDFDWRGGVANVWEMWQHTRQQRAMTNLIWDRLNDSSAAGRLAESIAAIADYDEIVCDWRLFYRDNPLAWPLNNVLGWRRSQPSSDRSTSNGNGKEQLEIRASLSRRWRQQRRLQRWMRALGYPPAAPRLPMETPQESTVAGFFYLGHCYVDEAVVAFRKAPQSQAGIKEMCQLSETLLKMWDMDEPAGAPSLEIAKQKQTLEQRKRKSTWDAIERLDKGIQLAWLYRQCQADESRQWCRNQRNTLLEQLVPWLALKESAITLPNTERTFIARLADEWIDNMYLWENAPPPRKPMKRFANPFNFEEPIRRISEKRRLVGRERELDPLKQLWKSGELRTVVLSGQRLIGKTSLVSVASLEAETNVRLAWLKLGALQPFHTPVKQFLYALCQAVETTTATPVIHLEHPEWDRDPFIVCQEYMRDASRFLDKQALWVVVDEFERLECLFTNHAELDQCLRFVTHLHQSIGQPGFVFITRSLPTRYRNPATYPFTNDSCQIQCSYLGRGQTPETRRALMDRFLNERLHPYGPRFRDEAIDAILDLTNGHPYLAALLAHFVVQRFLDRLGDEDPDPLFDDRDIHAVLDEEHVRRGVECFCRDIVADLHQSLGSDTSHLAQRILEVIAQSNGGMTVPALEQDPISRVLNDAGELRFLLHELRTLDVIEELKIESIDGYRICVELFRRRIIAN